MSDKLERMKAIVAQALAEAQQLNSMPLPIQVCLDLYSGCDEVEAQGLFAQASRDTLLEGARLILRRMETRYICWNCCGLRFEGMEGVCPNCGESAFEIPDDIPFALRQVSAVT